MAPRNSDASTSYKKNFPVEENDSNVKDIVPCLLHKKHKVVKLVKNQMQKIQKEGLLCATSGLELWEGDEEGGGAGGGGGGVEGRRRQRRGVEGDADETTMSRRTRRLIACWSLLMLILLIFLLILLMVWIAVGPFSNSTARTPFPGCSLFRIEGYCSLEKKCLLRWSKSDQCE